MSDVKTAQKTTPALSRIPPKHWRNLFYSPIGWYLPPDCFAVLLDPNTILSHVRWPSREIAEEKATTFLAWQTAPGGGWYGYGVSYLGAKQFDND